MQIPAITIEREYGSSGGEIARRLAKELDIAIYGKDLLEEAAKLAGITAREAYQLEEHKAGPLAKFVSGVFQLVPGVDAEEDYVYEIQKELIKGRAQAQPAVFVGRLAQDALAETNLDYIRIYITRPKEERIHQVEKLKNLSYNQAEKLVNKMDQIRSLRVKRHTDRVWGDANEYDLVINSDELGTEGSVRLLKEYIELRSLRRKARMK